MINHIFNLEIYEVRNLFDLKRLGDFGVPRDGRVVDLIIRIAADAGRSCNNEVRRGSVDDEGVIIFACRLLR